MIGTQQPAYNKFATGLPIPSPVMTIMGSVLLILVFLGATSYLYLQTSSASPFGQDSILAYGMALEEASQAEDAKREWKRLYKYHGNPAAVIYEEGKTAYFFDKLGNPCAFIDPPKKTGPLQPAKNSEYDVALMLNQESSLE